MHLRIGGNCPYFAGACLISRYLAKLANISPVVIGVLEYCLRTILGVAIPSSLLGIV